MNEKVNYLKIYMIISMVLSLIYILLFGISTNGNIKLFLILCLFSVFPFISAYIVFLIGKCTNVSHPLKTKIIANIINLFVLIVHFCFLFIIYALFFTFSELDTEYTNIEDYQKALNSYTSDVVLHFPTKIPANAQNITMRRSPTSFTGDSDFYLKFDISKDYIEQENQKFKAQGEVFNFEKNDFYISENYSYNDTGSILHYIINDDTSGWMVRKLERNQCFRGIATKNNTIVYILYCD